MTDIKNTLQNPQSTKPLVNRVPPQFANFRKPNLNLPKMSQSFRINQNRGSGGK